MFTFLAALYAFYRYCFCYYYHFCLKYLALKVEQSRQARRPRGTLTQTFKQPDSVCCPTWHVFRGVRWGDGKNMKMISRNISGSLSFVYPNTGPVLLPSTILFPRTFPSVFPNWHSDSANKLCTGNQPSNKGKLGASTIQHAKM